MTLSNLHSLLVEQLRALYAAESQLVRGIPKLIEGVSSSELKSLLSQHLEETEKHIERLDVVAAQLHEKLSGQRCRVVEALLKEAVELTERRGDDRVLDAGVLSLIRMIENFEKTAYEIARDLVAVLNESESLKAIDSNLLDENRCEQSMTVLFEDLVDSIHDEVRAVPSRPAAGLEEAAG